MYLQATDSGMSNPLLPITARRVGIMAELTGASGLAPLVDAAVEKLEANGFETVVVSAGRSMRAEQTAWHLLARSACDGIILHSDCLPNDQLARLISTRKNVVLANVHNTQTGNLAAAHLLQSGHKRIAMVSGPLHRFSVQHVVEGFMQQINTPQNRGVELQTLEASMDEEGGANAMNILLKSKKTPSGIFLLNDRMAIGALQTCQENGIRVPDDISLLGCGDQYASAHTRPALSTIRLPLAYVGAATARRVMNLINNVNTRQTEESGSTDTEPQLVSRYSVRNRNERKGKLVGDRHISARERECLNWAAKGKTSWEISQILGVTESTIIYHLRNATSKLNAANRLHAVAKALKASIIDF